ncbi:MAG: DUF5721 family protein [Hespellia sp.]|nr:DUF5721 family protein [Hespellia sp.]
MIAINLPNIKTCMAHLLLKETFDDFLFIEGEIVTANTFTIDGFIQKKFFEKDTGLIPEYTSWSALRDYCFSIIKGKRTPLSFKFIYSMSPDAIQKLITSASLDVDPHEIQGLYLNIKYDGEHLICITGTSFKSFSLDKTLEKAWDGYVQKFFEGCGIEYAKMEG